MVRAIVSPRIQGSGVPMEQTRTVEAFHSVDAGSALQVTIAVTPGAGPSLKISGDDNLVPLIESTVEDGSLVLRVKENQTIVTKLPLKAEVVTSELDEVKATGAAQIQVTGGSKVDRFTTEARGAARVSVDALETQSVDASSHGASHVVVSGSAKALKLSASGASHVKAENLKVDEAEISISGASGGGVNASKSVSGDVSGASKLEVYGHPATKTVSISGAGSVRDKD
jgi:hypothetical protein